MLARVRLGVWGCGGWMLRGCQAAGRIDNPPPRTLPQNQVVLSRGTNIDAGTIGLLASAGFAKATVHRRPCVGVLSTGNEVRDAPQDVADTLKPGEIRDANRPMLLAALGPAGAGLRVVDLGHTPDSKGALEAALQAALHRDDVDAVVTTGGVSMGAMDLLKGAVQYS